MCKVSIIVPLYNGEKTIGRCLDSLIRQELQDIEILVVNDGSTDNGERSVHSYMEKDTRIRLISQKNQGLGAARNHGIREASGMYVGFVDCDDFVSPQMFSVMTEAMERTGTPVAVCQEQNVYLENGEIQPINETAFAIEKETVFPAETILKWQINYTYLSLNSMCYKVVERRLFTDFGIQVPEQYRHAEDIVASVNIYAKAGRVVVVPKSLYYYVHTKGSISYNYSLRHAQDVYLDWEESVSCIKKNDIKINTDNFSLGMYFTSLKQIYWAKDKNERNLEETKKLIGQWIQARSEAKWKPDFSEVSVPIFHRIKVYVAYFHLCRPVLAIIRLLQWIPLFKYLT